MADGSIDAAFIVAETPTQAVQFLEESSDLYLVSLDDEHIDMLLEKSPFYSESAIPADTYGLVEDTITVDVEAVLLANNKVSDDDVYNVISIIFDNAAEIAQEDEKGEELNLEMLLPYKVFRIIRVLRNIMRSRTLPFRQSETCKRNILKISDSSPAANAVGDFCDFTKMKM